MAEPSSSEQRYQQTILTELEMISETVKHINENLVKSIALLLQDAAPSTSTTHRELVKKHVETLTAILSQLQAMS